MVPWLWLLINRNQVFIDQPGCSFRCWAKLIHGSWCLGFCSLWSCATQWICLEPSQLGCTVFHRVHQLLRHMGCLLFAEKRAFALSVSHWRHGICLKLPSLKRGRVARLVTGNRIPWLHLTMALLLWHWELLLSSESKRSHIPFLVRRCWARWWHDESCRWCQLCHVQGRHDTCLTTGGNWNVCTSRIKDGSRCRVLRPCQSVLLGRSNLIVQAIDLRLQSFALQRADNGWRCWLRQVLVL